MVLQRVQIENENEEEVVMRERQREREREKKTMELECDRFEARVSMCRIIADTCNKRNFKILND